jgi:hypothetical protein
MFVSDKTGPMPEMFPPVTFAATNISLGASLDRVLPLLGLDYTINDEGEIVLRKMAVQPTGGGVGLPSPKR